MKSTRAMVGLTLMTLLFLAPVALAAKSERLPLAAGIIVNKARILFQEGEIQTAINTLEEFINRQTDTDPATIKTKGYNHYYLHFLLGNYYLALFQEDPGNNGAPQKAVQCYRAAVKVNPAFNAAWLNLAKCFYEAGNYKEAALAFEKGYETSPDSDRGKNAIYLYYAAVCHFQSQNYEKALALFDILLTKYPDKVTRTWKEILVNIFFSLGRYNDALPHIEELAQKNKPPKQKKWQETLLHQYLSLGMDSKALSYADYLTRKDPLEPKWWKSLSHIHLKNSNKEEGQREGLAALIIYGFLSPMTREEMGLVADLYLTLDIPQKAAAAYEQVVRQYAVPGQSDEPGMSLKPDGFGQVWLMLGYSSMNCARYDRAKKAFEKALGYKKQKKLAIQAIARIKSIQEVLDKIQHHPELEVN